MIHKSLSDFDDSRPGHVLLVHGLAAHRSCLWLMAHRLRSRGFQTHVWGYPSILHGVRRHARRLRDRVESLDHRLDGEPLHLVVHSMGGILTRLMLADYRPRNLGRVVMLGTPNQGSHAARILTPYLSWACRPLREISDQAGSPIYQVPVPADVDIGVVAGTRDRVVRVSATHLPGLADHCLVPSGHGELLFRRDVVKHVSDFLVTGSFGHDARRDQRSVTDSQRLAQESSVEPLTLGS